MVDGKKFTRSFVYEGTRDMGRAKRLAEAALDELREGHLGEQRTDESLAEFLERWLIHVEPQLRNMTHVGYTGMVKNHIVPHLGRRALSRVSVADVDLFLATLAREGKSPTLRARARKILGRALGQAVAWGLIETNPVRASTPPSIPTVERQTLNSAQARTFLDAIRGERLEAAFLLGACLGLRSGEIRALTWSDVGEGWLSITKTLAYNRLRDGSHEYRLAETKTPRSRRTLPLPAFVAEALERRREAQKHEIWSPEWPDLIFTTETQGRPLASFLLMKRLKEVLAEAGLPEIPFHGLRHAAASLLLAQGLPPRVVQDVLGHTKATFTMEVYAHVSDEQRLTVARTLEAWRG